MQLIEISLLSQEPDNISWIASENLQFRDKKICDDLFQIFLVINMQLKFIKKLFIVWKLNIMSIEDFDHFINIFALFFILNFPRQITFITFLFLQNQRWTHWLYAIFP